MHVGAGNRADHVGGADLARRRLVEAGRIAHRALDQMVEDRERDIDEQQAGDGLVDAAIVAQAAGQRDPERRPRHAGDRHRHLHHERRRVGQQQRGRGRGQRADQQRALAADDHHAELRRQRRAQRRQDQRRRARERVLPGEPGAERALVHVEIEIDRILAEQRDEDAERDQRRHQGERRDDDVFRRAADAAVNRVRSGSPLPATAAPAGEVTSVVLRIPVRSLPPCGRVGRGVGFIARAASTNDCPPAIPPALSMGACPDCGMVRSTCYPHL